MKAEKCVTESKNFTRSCWMTLRNERHLQIMNSDYIEYGYVAIYIYGGCVGGFYIELLRFVTYNIRVLKEIKSRLQQSQQLQQLQRIHQSTWCLWKLIGSFGSSFEWSANLIFKSVGGRKCVRYVILPAFAQLLQMSKKTLSFHKTSHR